MGRGADADIDTVGSRFAYLGGALLILVGVLQVLAEIGIAAGALGGVISFNSSFSLGGILGISLPSFVWIILNIVCGIAAITIMRWGKNGEMNKLGVSLLALLVGLVPGGIGGLFVVIGACLFLIS